MTLSLSVSKTIRLLPSVPPAAMTRDLPSPTTALVWTSSLQDQVLPVRVMVQISSLVARAERQWLVHTLQVTLLLVCGDTLGSVT